MKKSLLTILLLIPLTLLIPGIGSGGEPPISCAAGSFPGFVLPAYFGNLTMEWVSDCGFGPYGCLHIYGELKRPGGGRKNDIIIKRNSNASIPIGSETVPFDQVAFLGLEPTDLTFSRGFGFYLSWEGKYFGISSANDLDYKTGTLFTVDVVVMEIQCISAPPPPE